MGKAEARMMSTASCRLGDHVSVGPSLVLVQSTVWNSRAMPSLDDRHPAGGSNASSAISNSIAASGVDARQRLVQGRHKVRLQTSPSDQARDGTLFRPTRTMRT